MQRTIDRQILSSFPRRGWFRVLRGPPALKLGAGSAKTQIGYEDGVPLHQLHILLFYSFSIPLAGDNPLWLSVLISGVEILCTSYEYG